MPTIATASVVGHLYGPVELRNNDRGSFAIVKFWTSDKIKGKGGKEDEKKFTSWEGFVSGPQAEWLARDAKKGSLVFVSGTIRMDHFTKDDGTESHRISFTRINECRLLEREDAPIQTTAAPKPAPIKPAVVVDADGPPF